MNKKRKIMRVAISRELLKQLFTSGWGMATVTKNALPDDAFLIYTEFNQNDGCFDMYFLSDIRGTELIEGQRFDSVERSDVVFERIEPMDKYDIKSDSTNMLFRKALHKIGIHTLEDGSRFIELETDKPVWARAHLCGEYYRYKKCIFCDYVAIFEPWKKLEEIKQVRDIRKVEGMKAISLWDSNKYPKDQFGKTYKDLKFKGNRVVGYKRRTKNGKRNK